MSPQPLVVERGRRELHLRLDRKYQFMEANNQRRVVGLKDKIPDIQKTLETVQFLKTRKVSVTSLRSPVAAWTNGTAERRRALGSHV